MSNPARAAAAAIAAQCASAGISADAEALIRAGVTPERLDDTIRAVRAARVVSPALPMALVRGYAASAMDLGAVRADLMGMVLEHQSPEIDPQMAPDRVAHRQMAQALRAAAGLPPAEKEP